MQKHYETRAVSIVTKYYGPTNTKGSRIKADAGRGRTKWISYPHDEREPHLAAAMALCEHMGWQDNMLISGGTETGDQVFVMVHPREFDDLKSAMAD